MSESPTAPSFRANFGKQVVTVEYDPVDHAIVALSKRGGVVARSRVLPHHEPLEVEGGTFHWNDHELEPLEDDYGLAVAFAHFVNSRKALTAADQFFGEPLGDETRWQYGVVNVGSFGSPERMSEVLAAAGSGGWELVTVYDKASNWFAGMEKGFMLFKRPVPSGVEPHNWCISFRH